VYGLTGGSRRPDKAKPPSGTKAGMAPVVSSPAALRLPGRGVGFRGAFREKTPAPSNKKAG
ncbi:TPA: hypothetical protein MIM91_25255, partial [Klebsiella pneumoniae]|nr:hypothetical protein [Klebsiella pneumoniae]